eukprot:361415-Chlamydomonas_euryale.AAC.4
MAGRYAGCTARAARMACFGGVLQSYLCYVRWHDLLLAQSSAPVNVTACPAEGAPFAVHRSEQP